MIISVDFDNTIVKTVVHGTKVRISRTKFLARKVINKLYEDGHIIIINTLREDRDEKPNKGKALTEAKKFLDSKGIKYHLVNANPPHVIKVWGESRKIAADIYIDDRNIVPLVSWPIIYLIIKIKTWLRSL